MNPTAESILDALEKAQLEQHEAVMTTIRYCRTLLIDSKARSAGDNEWTRMPISPRRCHISGWSRSTIEAHGKAGDIRTKLVKGKRYYAGPNIRQYLAKA